MNIKTIIDWAWFSSANPTDISLTIKGASIYIVPILITLAGVDATTAGELVSDGATLVATVITAMGLVRKLYKTANGTNASLQ